MFKNTSAIFVSVCFTILGSAAHALDSDKVFGGFDTSSNLNFGYVGGAVALNNNIRSDGWLVRADASYGQYSYSRPGRNIDGDFTTEDLLLGYQKLLPGDSHFAMYAGGDYQDHSLNKNDTLNPVNGDKFGVKGLVDLRLGLDDKTYTTAAVSYSSAYDTYWSNLRFGYNLGHFAIGPEAVFLGNQVFDQQRFGGFIGDIHPLDNLSITLSGGYSRATGLIDESGGYGDISVGYVF